MTPTDHTAGDGGERAPIGFGTLRRVAGRWAYPGALGADAAGLRRLGAGVGRRVSHVAVMAVSVRECDVLLSSSDARWHRWTCWCRPQVEVGEPLELGNSSIDNAALARSDR